MYFSFEPTFLCDVVIFVADIHPKAFYTPEIVFHTQTSETANFHHFLDINISFLFSLSSLVPVISSFLILS